MAHVSQRAGPQSSSPGYSNSSRADMTRVSNERTGLRSRWSASGANLSKGVLSEIPSRPPTSETIAKMLIKVIVRYFGIALVSSSPIQDQSTERVARSPERAYTLHLYITVMLICHVDARCSRRSRVTQAEEASSGSDRDRQGRFHTSYKGILEPVRELARPLSSCREPGFRPVWTARRQRPDA